MGMGPLHQHVAEQRRQQEELLRQQQQQALANAAVQPIPGATGPTTPGAGRIPGVLGYGPGGPAPTGWRPNSDATRSMMGGLASQWMNDNMSSSDWQSLLPQGQPSPQGAMNPPQSPQAPFQAGGPYAQQAVRMAGLLGPQTLTPPPGRGGLLGGVKRPHTPGGK